MSDSHLYFTTHVFCCTNDRVPSPNEKRPCCAAAGAEKLRNYMKVRAKELGIASIRINNSGCLDRCELGPVMVIYPEGVWYSYHNKDDVEEILQRHIIEGKRVERLLLQPDDRPSS